MRQKLLRIPKVHVSAASETQLKSVRSALKTVGIVNVSGAVRPSRISDWDENISQQLTKKEIDVLQTISDLGTIGATAKRLGVSRRTVDSHLAHIRLKLDVQTTVEAVAKAWRKGLIK